MLVIIDNNYPKRIIININVFLNIQKRLSHSLENITVMASGKHHDSDFAQVGFLFQVVITETDRQHFVNNIVGLLKNAQKHLQYRQAA